MPCISTCTRPSPPHTAAAAPAPAPPCCRTSSPPRPPWPFIVKPPDGLRLVEHASEAKDSFGRMCAFHGQMGMFTRALAYILSHGADGLRHVSSDAVLNANYLLEGAEG